MARATRLAAGIPFDDSQCGYTAANRTAAGLAVNEDVWPGYGYPNDLLVLFGRRGIRVAEVPVRPVYGDEASGLRLWHPIRILAVIARRAYRERRRALRAITRPSKPPEALPRAR